MMIQNFSLMATYNDPNFSLMATYNDPNFSLTATYSDPNFSLLATYSDLMSKQSSSMLQPNIFTCATVN